MKTTGNDITNSNVVRTAKNNPFPLLLIGLGAGLLTYQAMGSRNRRFPGRNFTGAGREFAEYENLGRESRGGDTRSTFGSAREKVGEATTHAYERVTTAANSAVEGVSEKLSTAYTGAADMANRTYETAGEYAHKAQETYDHYIEENPLAVGAVALALGAAVGFAIPSTRYEGELMGDAREKLMGKAQSAASGWAERARQAAGEAGETLKKEAQQLIH